MPASAQRLRIAGVEITHPDRVVFPDLGLTKGDLARFYHDLGPWILPHLAHRPLSLVRCPEGEAGQCFYQKHTRDYMPAYIGRLEIEEQDGTDEYIEIHARRGLIYLVQIGALEFHPWAARADRLERPDRLIFDLDPAPGAEWASVIECARQVRERLDAHGLTSFVKTTGGKGLHVIAPLRRRHTWEEVKEFAHRFAERLAADAPGYYTTELPKHKRAGRIFLDYLRNQRGATTVGAYSTRARTGAPISTPLAWEELSPALHSDHFTVANLPARLASTPDPWAEFWSLRQGLPRAR